MTGGMNRAIVVSDFVGVPQPFRAINDDVLHVRRNDVWIGLCLDLPYFANLVFKSGALIVSGVMCDEAHALAGFGNAADTSTYAAPGFSDNQDLHESGVRCATSISAPKVLLKPLDQKRAMACSRIALDTKQRGDFGFTAKRFDEPAAVKAGHGFVVAGNESFAQRGALPFLDPGCLVGGGLSFSQLG